MAACSMLFPIENTVAEARVYIARLRDFSKNAKCVRRISSISGRDDLRTCYSNSISANTACAFRRARAANCSRYANCVWSTLGAPMMSAPASM